MGLTRCQAGGLSSQASIEIEALLTRLGDSGCQLYRNGTWYDPTRARDHLAQKLHYFADRDLLASAEQFIELAATKSGVTGAASSSR